MIADQQQIWARRREIAATLPAVSWLRSTDEHRQVIEADRTVAAGGIADGTHVVASADEVAAHLAEIEDRGRGYATDRYKTVAYRVEGAEA